MNRPLTNSPVVELSRVGATIPDPGPGPAPHAISAVHGSRFTVQELVVRTLDCGCSVALAITMEKNVL